MHNALLNSEVFGYIVDHLAEDAVQTPKGFPAGDTRTDSRRALAVLARTCRAFSEPALDGVWRRLHSLKPFVLCLPSRGPYDDDTTEDETLPPFNKDEWNIVQRYAPRVRVLTLEYDRLSVNILQSLCFCTTPLLHNLWRFYFSHSEGVPHVMPTISRAISGSPNLEALACDQLDEAGFIHVIGSRCLQMLNASLLNYQPNNLRRLARHFTPDRPPFENMRVLELRIEDISSITPYLRSQNQPIEEILLRSPTQPTPEVLHEFFTALSSPTRHRTLRRIRLSALRLLEHGFSRQLVSFQVLSPLMAFNLHVLDVNTKNPISLNDDEFVRLIQAWPELVALNFNESSQWDVVYPPSFQTPTLRGLLLLLARCPKLRGLGMCIDARNIPSLSADESLIQNTAITKLAISHSPIQEPIAGVAHFLLEHLPSLIAIPALPFLGGQPWRGYYWKWRGVEKQIREILGRSPTPEWNEFEMDDM